MRATLAVILARGLGTRLRHEDGTALDAAQSAAAAAGSKGLVPLAGRPLLDYLLHELAEGGVRDVVLVVPPGDSPLRDRYERDAVPSRLGVRFAVQDAPRGTAHALLAAREAVCAAAVRAAKAVQYEGAGTIEFIADGSEGLRADRIWFMEMNTRLQVEHPVTEAITGVDLVEWQLRVAAGEPLPRRQDELAINGWAMEARLYAEDPARGFLPSIGRLDVLRFGSAHGGRIDTGVYERAEVSPFYDPMIAKVIAHGASREQAVERLDQMLRGTAVWPVRTNAAFLVKALAHPQFRAGTVDTGLIGRDGDELAQPPAPSAAALEQAAQTLMPRSDAPGFRLNAAPQLRARFLLDGEPVDIALSGHGADQPAASALVLDQGQVWRLEPWRRDGAHGAAAGDGAILAPMPGKVIAVSVAEGEAVTRGQKLLTLEAMKMEHTLTAPFDGVVTELKVSAGAQVQVEALLARIEEGAA